MARLVDWIELTAAQMDAEFDRNQPYIRTGRSSVSGFPARHNSSREASHSTRLSTTRKEVRAYLILPGAILIGAQVPRWAIYHRLP